jgi:hypothetical protein
VNKLLLPVKKIYKKKYNVLAAPSKYNIDVTVHLQILISQIFPQQNDVE